MAVWSGYEAIERTRAIRWMLDQPSGLHISCLVLLGKTAEHLAEHKLQGTEDRRENLTLHWEAHRKV